MPLTDEQRSNIVKIAKEWHGTPYRPHSCMKNCGTDCGQLLKGVFLEAGHRPDDGVPLATDYSVDIWLHKDDTSYIDTVSKYMREIPESEVKPGDVVLYKFGRGYAHAAIIIKWPEYVVHALKREGVTAGHGMNLKFGRREKKFFTLKDENC